jgi:hypothetical protein
VVQKVCKASVTYIQLRKLNPIFDKICAEDVNGLLENVFFKAPKQNKAVD